MPLAAGLWRQGAGVFQDMVSRTVETRGLLCGILDLWHTGWHRVCMQETGQGNDNVTPSQPEPRTPALSSDHSCWEKPPLPMCLHIHTQICTQTHPASCCTCFWKTKNPLLLSTCLVQALFSPAHSVLTGGTERSSYLPRATQLVVDMLVGPRQPGPMPSSHHQLLNTRRKGVEATRNYSSSSGWEKGWPSEGVVCGSQPEQDA